MKRLRTRLIALFLLTVLTGIVGTLFFTARAAISDKRNYIIELNSVTAPQVASSAGRSLQALRDGLDGLDPILRRANRSHDQRTEDLLESATSRLSGVLEIETYSGTALDQRLVLDTSRPDLRHAPPLLSPDELQNLSRARFPLLIHDSRLGLIFASVSTGSPHLIHAALLSAEFFRSAFELARDRDTALLNSTGEVLQKRGEFPLQRAPASVLSLVRDLSGATVVARELELPGGKRVLASLSPVPGLKGAVLLVQAPAVTLPELLAPVARSATPFLAAILMISLLMAVLFANSIALPVEKLTEATSRIATGQWSVPSVRNSSFEINRLARAFGKMVRDLEKRDQQIQRANEELVRSERLTALGKFSAGIAHEVKNPLSSILGYAQLIQRKASGSLDEGSTKYLGFILDETRRANRIITDLLMFARQKPPTLQATNLADEVSRAREMLGPQAEAKGVELVEEILAPDARARIDREQLFQVISNLVMNAVQALESKGDGQRLIRLILETFNDQVVIQVKDNGPGIREEHLSKLFEPFFSTKEVGKGSGLGLSLCHGIISQHGGRIDVQSRCGDGATFSIHLPAIQKE